MNNNMTLSEARKLEIESAVTPTLNKMVNIVLDEDNTFVKAELQPCTIIELMRMQEELAWFRRTYNIAISKVVSGLRRHLHSASTQQEAEAETKRREGAPSNIEGSSTCTCGIDGCPMNSPSKELKVVTLSDSDKVVKTNVPEEELSTERMALRQLIYVGVPSSLEYGDSVYISIDGVGYEISTKEVAYQAEAYDNRMEEEEEEEGGYE